MNRRFFPAIMVLALILASCAGPARRAERTMPYEDRLRLASIYIQSERPDRAVPILKDAAVQEPGRPEAHAMLGEVLFIAGDLEGSAQSMTRALEVGGDDPVVLNNLAWVEMKRGKNEEALDLVERALKADPFPRYPYLDTKARALKSLGRFQEALQQATEALRMTPEYDAKMRTSLEELIGELEMEAPDAGYY